MRRRAILQIGTCLVGVAVGLSALAMRGWSEELTAPRAEDRRVAQIVAALLPRQHVSRSDLDDEKSQRALDLFLKSLDPMKLYFLKSDIDEFSDFRLQIDDKVRTGDISIAYTVFNRFLERVDQRAATALELLERDFDFSRDEAMVSDPEAARYPVDDDEAAERWRRQIKYSLLVLKDEGKTDEEARETLQRRYTRLKSRWHQTDADELLEMFLTAVTTSYDPHTTYMSQKSLDNFQIMMRLNLEGIGAALRDKDGYTVVSKIIPGGAADKHGKLKEDDAIVSVGQGEDGPMVDIVDMKLDDVVEMIRGKADTIVRLGVKAGGVGETKVYTITRAKVELEDSAARSQIVEFGKREDGSPARFGYINLPSFYMDMEGARNGGDDYRSSTRDVRRILDQFREDGDLDSVILDLRMNGGGSLTEAINLTGLFIDRGPVVQVKDSDGTIEPYADEDAGVAWDGPLVVVTSHFSASASEILAGAIQDYRRGIVIGDEKTHGKGTVQTLMDLGQQVFRTPRPPKYGALKLTLQQFYLPDGESTQKAGVGADIVLPSLTTYMEGIDEADLDYALENDRVPAAEHRYYNMVPADVLGSVRAKSAGRIEKSEDFDELLQRIESYREQKDEKFVTLNEEEFKERRKKLNAQKEEEKQLMDQQIPDDEVFRHNFYNDEVLNIARDYANALTRQNLARAD